MNMSLLAPYSGRSPACLRPDSKELPSRYADSARRLLVQKPSPSRDCGPGAVRLKIFNDFGDSPDIHINAAALIAAVREVCGE